MAPDGLEQDRRALPALARHRARASRRRARRGGRRPAWRRRAPRPTASSATLAARGGRRQQRRAERGGPVRAARGRGRRRARRGRRAADAPRATATSAREAPARRARGSASRPSHPHLLAQGGEALLADPGDLAELLDGAEAAVLLAVLEDRGGHARADAVELVELLRGGGVEVEWGHPRPASAPAATAPRRGTSTWRPSSSLAARFRAERSARRRAPPARRTASTTRARRQPVDARPPDRARDVDGHPRRPSAPPHVDRRGRRGLGDASSRAQVAPRGTPPPRGRAPRGRGRGGACRARLPTLGRAGPQISGRL